MDFDLIVDSRLRGGVSLGAEGAIAPTVSEKIPTPQCIAFALTVLMESRIFA